MEKALYRLLNEERVRDFVLRGQKVHMVLLSAAELLELRAKESAEEGGDAFADGVHGCAALAARACASAERQYSKAPKKCCRR